MGTLYRRILALLRPNRLERDLDDELAFHLAMREAEHRNAGIPSAQAEKAARHQFGNVRQVKEQSRDAWLFGWCESVLQDVRFAIRGFRRSPGFTALAIVTLALGIGVANTTFGIVNAGVIRGLPFSEPDRLVYVGLREARQRYGSVSYPEYRDLQAVRSINLAAYEDGPMILAEDGRPPDRLQGAYISAAGFELLGAIPTVGRGFRPDDDVPGAAPVVLLGEAVWRRRYERDPAIVGRTVRVNGSASTVIGVMPERFGFPENADIWQTLAQMPELATQGRDTRALRVIGRLTEASLAQARQEVEQIADRWQQEHAATNANIRGQVIPLMEAEAAPEVKQIFLVVLGAGALVLLIACANVANLLLARAAHRQHEMATRVAMGASRSRIVRQLLVESMVFAGGAGVAAFALSAMGIRFFSSAITATNPPWWLHFTIDWRVFVFLVMASLASSVIFGLVPALHISRSTVREGLQEGGRGASHGVRARRWTSALVAAELALTLVLLTSAGLMLRAFWSVYSPGLGFDTRNLTVLRLDMAGPQYATPAQRAAFSGRLEERLRAIPVLLGATIATSPPGSAGQWALSLEGRTENPDDKPVMVTTVGVGDDYFRTLDEDLLRGRSFGPADGTTGHEYAIVNQRFASMFFPSDDPLGRRIRVSRTGNAPVSSGWVSIIGVAPNIWQRPALLQNEADAVVYLPYRTQPSSSAVLVARAPHDAGTVATQIRAELLALDPDLPVYDIQSLDQFLAFFRWPQRVFGTVLTILAAIALVLAVVGLYGITAYSAAQRTHEIGIRMALGAQAVEILLLVLRRALAPLGAGFVIGIAGALAIGRLLTAFLVDTDPTDLITLISVAVILVSAGMLACVLPAYRASRFDPLLALRHE